MDPYRVQVEVAGPLAMFARPDTGGTPTSYPVPTWSASKGIFESVAMLSSGEAWMSPTKVEVCRRIGEPGGTVRFQRYTTNYRRIGEPGGTVRFQRYTTNYGGPLRKDKLVSAGTGMQLFATVLVDVCYRLYGDVIIESEVGGNAAHYLQDLFTRRVKQGRCFRTPCLGWREFTCSYWGEFRADSYETDDSLTLVIPSMLHSVWDKGHNGQYEPEFAQNVKIERGVLRYAQ
jgi:CRISPR-associated protein Cas5d